jgi:hypothetical protein
MVMIIGAHSILYSRNAEADREFLRDVVGLSHVDVGGGWLIFGLPPAEVAVHPGEENDVHEFYLMCDDVAAFVQRMAGKGVACAPVQSLGWGQLTQVTLPGGGRLGIYEPRHARPKPMRAVKRKKAPPAKVRRGSRRAAPRRPRRRPAASTRGRGRKR